MGNSDSNEQTNQTADWSQWQNQQGYTNTMQQAYSQTEAARYQAGYQPQTGAYGQKHIPESENKTMTAVKVDFDIDTNSLKLEPDMNIPNTFNLTGIIKSQVPVDVMIYYVAKLNIDRQSSAIQSIHPKRPEDCRKFSFGSGESKLEPGMSQLNFSHYSFMELSKAFNDVIPILVILERKTKLPRMLEKVVYFLQIQQKDLTLKVISKSSID